MAAPPFSAVLLVTFITDLLSLRLRDRQCAWLRQAEPTAQRRSTVRTPAAASRFHIPCNNVHNLL